MAKAPSRKPALSVLKAQKQVSVDVPSFTKGLVTLVPSESAGMVGQYPAGATPSPQAQTVTFGPDSKDAVVVASNMRFRDMATMNSEGYQPITGFTLDSPVNLIFFSQQLGAAVPSPGTFLVFATGTDIFVGRAQ